MAYVLHLRDAKGSGTRILDSRQYVKNNYLEIHQRQNEKICTRVLFLFQYFFILFMYVFTSFLLCPLLIFLWLSHSFSNSWLLVFTHKQTRAQTHTHTHTSCFVHLTLSVCIFLCILGLDKLPGLCPLKRLILPFSTVFKDLQVFLWSRRTLWDLSCLYWQVYWWCSCSGLRETSMFLRLHSFSSSIINGRYCVTTDIPFLLPLDFHLSSWCSLILRHRGCAAYVSSHFGHHLVNCSRHVHFDQLQISEMFSSRFKRKCL